MIRRVLTRGAILGLVLLAAGLAACAARVPPMPPEPVTPRFPAFVFPGAPAAADPVTGERQRRGWRFLQAGDLRNAEREFTDGLRRVPDFAPAETGLAYVALARQQVPQALERFGRALAAQPDYAPALVGQGEAYLVLNRHADALDSFQAAMAADPALDLIGRVEVVRLRAVQDRVAAARLALQRGDLPSARAGYEAAIRATPQSGFLHRELGLVEQRAGHLGAAARHYREALALDPDDVRAHTGLGDVLQASGDLSAALDAYSAAWAIEPSPTLDQRITALRARLATAALPAEYNEIAGSPAVTRADLAAVLGVRMAEWLEGTTPRGVLVTDASGHWASAWIAKALRAGVMEPFPNHTFQPDLALNRAELAAVVSRVLDLIGRHRPEADASWRTARPDIADVPRSHLAYPDVARAVAAGVLRLSDGAFQLARPVTGAEVMDVVERLRGLGGQAPVAARP